MEARKAREGVVTGARKFYLNERTATFVTVEDLADKGYSTEAIELTPRTLAADDMYGALGELLRGLAIIAPFLPDYEIHDAFRATEKRAMAVLAKAGKKAKGE